LKIAALYLLLQKYRFIFTKGYFGWIFQHSNPQVMHLKLLIISCICITMIACDRPKCSNTNTVFDTFAPNSTPYKAELAKQMRQLDASKLTYWLKDYEESDGKTYLNCYVQGDGLCAILQMSVEQWDKLEGVKNDKGRSYKGAEFRNLAFDIAEKDGNIEFLYRKLDKIID
jgi:hypothetical protein